MQVTKPIQFLSILFSHLATRWVKSVASYSEELGLQFFSFWKLFLFCGHCFIILPDLPQSSFESWKNINESINNMLSYILMLVLITVLMSIQVFQEPCLSNAMQQRTSKSPHTCRLEGCRGDHLLFKILGISMEKMTSTQQERLFQVTFNPEMSIFCCKAGWAEKYLGRTMEI